MLSPRNQWLIGRGFPPESDSTDSTNPTRASERLPIRPKSPKSNTLNSPVPAKRTEIPKNSPNPPQVVVLGPPRPLSAFDDDPVTPAVCAAQILGVDVETLKKWRQRNQGPDYIQYGRGGPVRYALSALKAFREAHTIRIQNNLGIGSRRRRESGRGVYPGPKSSIFP